MSLDDGFNIVHDVPPSFAKAIRRYSVAIRRYSVAMELRRIAMVSYAKATEYPINNPFRSPKGEGWELRRIASEGSPFAKSPPMERRGIRRRRINLNNISNISMERYRSLVIPGRSRKPLFLKWTRGFKSHPLRQKFFVKISVFSN